LLTDTLGALEVVRGDLLLRAIRGGRAGGSPPQGCHLGSRRRRGSLILGFERTQEFLHFGLTQFVSVHSRIPLPSVPWDGTLFLASARYWRAPLLPYLALSVDHVLVAGEFLDSARTAWV